VSRHARRLTALALALLLAAASGPAGATGLDSRPANATCSAFARPISSPALRVRLEPMFGALALAFPTAIEQSTLDPNFYYAMERYGRIQRVDATTNTKSVALDIASRLYVQQEGGMVGLALHPDFSSNLRIYVFYTIPNAGEPGFPVRSILSEFTSLDGGVTFAVASERVLLSIPQTTGSHKGGDLHFGADGYLYAGFGESDEPLMAQDLSSFYGKFIRIDVDSGTPYAIPPDNPFALGGGLPEIWAFGFRNPFRWTFDDATGILWAADVGGSQWEEIDHVEPGLNYGWPHREGAHCLRTATCVNPAFVEPELEYSHLFGCAIIGGRVYHGSAIPALEGAYLYGDFCSARVWAALPLGAGAWSQEELTVAPIPFSSFGETADGEILVLHLQGVYKLVPDDSPPAPPLPTSLIETGCVDPSAPTKPPSGAIPFEVNEPLWSDGADKGRWFAIPDGTFIQRADDGDFVLPERSVAVKTFYLGGEPIETRLFMHHDDGSWAGYTYEWNESGTDATLLTTGKQKVIGSQTWTYPSREQCMQCHTYAAGFTLGLEVVQLNRDYYYEASHRTANQLATLDHIGMFSVPLGPPGAQPALRRDTLANAARGYLHSNCSNCHRPDGGTGARFDIRYNTSISLMQVCNVSPVKGNLGIPGARLLVPGSPATSILSVRPHLVGANQMPPLARSIVDAAGTSLIDAWITSWPSCSGPDSDLDGALDTADNCPAVANATQTDSNGNGVGDACETACNDELDNDGDGRIDFPLDPGCSSAFAGNESPACNDTVDNDGDGAVDGPLDIGCAGQSAATERPACADAADNDQDGRVDFDGGAWAGLPPTPPDPQCKGRPTTARERVASCGLGFELVLPLGGLLWLRRRQQRLAPGPAPAA
jgi:uncharacterized repeat protein (TIGR03806 family)